jgi:hypothetical protein
MSGSEFHSADDAALPGANPPRHQEVIHYTPGHPKRKILMILVGLLILFYGLGELAPPLWLMAAGSRTTAEATRIIKTKAGLPDQIFLDDLHANAAEENRDRSYIFWNEFHFSTPDGIEHVVREPIGRQLKPLFPLLDSDGLPTNVRLYYNAADPAKFCIPIVMSTWFAPGLITLMGIVCTSFGCVLLYWSGKEIEIP